MEDKDGLDALDAVQSLKVGLMGPLAGVGDSLGWILLPTIFGSIAGYMGTKGNPIGLIIWCTLYVVFYIWRLSWWNYGYKLGASFISAIGNKLNAFTECASILGLFVVGAMIPSVVTMTTGLKFKYGDVSMNIQKDILDAILPCMLPLALTVVVYKLLKKGVKLTYIILLSNAFLYFSGFCIVFIVPRFCNTYIPTGFPMLSIFFCIAVTFSLYVTTAT